VLNNNVNYYAVTVVSGEPGVKSGGDPVPGTLCLKFQYIRQKKSP